MTELDADDPDFAFGLFDLGLGCAEQGLLRLSKIVAVRGKFGLPVERDLWFAASKPLSAYSVEAAHAGRIIA